jgi:integrase
MTTHVQYIPNPQGQLQITDDLTFEEASERYLRSRTIVGIADGLTRRHSRYAPQYIGKKTMHGYEQYVKTLNLFFASTPLRDIDADRLRAYQHARLLGSEPFIRYRLPHHAKSRTVNGVVLPPKGKTSCPAGSVKVNHELTFLQTILRRAGLWKPPLSDQYEPLHVAPTEIPRALTGEQEHEWLTASRSLERLWPVHWYSVLALHTCMGTNELASLKLGDISLESGVLTVPIEGAKNRFRHRTIPLDEQATWAVKNLMIRAQACGTTEPTHYLFPFRVGNGPWDPTRPMSDSGLKKAWIEVQAMTGLTWFRRYDLRHTAITRFAENGVPLQVIMSFAGHISAQMTQHYTHISTQTQLRALQHVRRRIDGKTPHSPWLSAPPIHVARLSKNSMTHTTAPSGSSASSFLTSSLNWTGGSL